MLAVVDQQKREDRVGQQVETKFETITCSRCHGGGKYSYCQEYGDRCFKCGGSGKVLSTRGAVAQKFYTDLCSIKLSEVKVGDRIRVQGMTSNMRLYYYVGTVIEIKRSESQVTSINGGITKTWYPLSVTTEHPKYGKSGMLAPDDTLVRIYRDDDIERFNKAIEYQASLTKTGTVRKRKTNKPGVKTPETKEI